MLTSAVIASVAAALNRPVLIFADFLNTTATAGRRIISAKTTPIQPNSGTTGSFEGFVVGGAVEDAGGEVPTVSVGVGCGEGVEVEVVEGVKAPLTWIRSLPDAAATVGMETIKMEIRVKSKSFSRIRFTHKNTQEHTVRHKI